MVMPLFDMVPGTEPTIGTDLFVFFITLLLAMPFFYYCFLYVMRALGLYRIAKRRGIHRPWLAWIPCGRDWLLGCISDHYQSIACGKRSYFRFFLLFLSIVSESLFYLSWLHSLLFPLAFMSWNPNAPLYLLLIESPLAQVFPVLVRLSPYLVAALLILRLYPAFLLYRSALPQYRFPLLILNILVPFSPAVTLFAVRNYDKYATNPN